MRDLKSRLLVAHMAGDSATLVELYRQAGEAAVQEDEVQGCFFLTHAYVFALEAGFPEAEELRRVLVQYGRES